jgi:hypothetical protein
MLSKVVMLHFKSPEEDGAREAAAEGDEAKPATP